MPQHGQQRYFLKCVRESDENNLTRQRVQVMCALPTEDNGVALFDDTGFPKQGRASIGVARQDSGSLGKLANCQITVNRTYFAMRVSSAMRVMAIIPHFSMV